MSNTEKLVLLALFGGVATAYLACGVFFAWLLGIVGGLTWLLVVAAWPVVVVFALILAGFGFWMVCALIRAVLP